MLSATQIVETAAKDRRKRILEPLVSEHGGRIVKFMGDGLLVLWDVSRPDENARRNIIITGREICLRYARDFYPQLGSKVSDPPKILRCGLARGTVYSVGNGNDFVGSCINMAARIQKLPGTTFAFNRRGVVIDEPTYDTPPFDFVSAS